MIKKTRWLLKEAALRMRYKMTKDCLFCKIIAGEVKSNIIYRDDTVVAFPDINPIAATHILIVPKKHIESAVSVGLKESSDLVAMFNAAKKISKEKGVDSFRLSFNVGKFQHVPHMHMHLLAGDKIVWSKL